MRGLVLLSLVPSALMGAPPDLVHPPADAVRDANGMSHRVTLPGRGGRGPQGNDILIAHFTGWDAEGKVVVQTRSADDPRSVPLDRLMPGMRMAFGQMTPGEQRRVWIPEALAFNGAAGKPRGTLVMDLELIDVLPHPSQPPADVSGPPPDAQKLRSGLRWKVLRVGHGKDHPRLSHHVSVHYSGWTTDGKLFDSSLLKGTPALLRMREVIDGWMEGLPLMVVGERRRFWIPEQLAYRGEAGKPKGMLVFDVELVGIHP